MTCLNCGCQNTDGVRFCSNCGAQFTPAAAQPDPAQSASAPPQPNPAQSTSTPPQPNITPEMMSSQWYYQNSLQVYGPVPVQYILKMLQDRVFTFDTPVMLAAPVPNQTNYGWAPIHQTFLYTIFCSGIWQVNKNDDVVANSIQGLKKAINDITGDSGKLNISFSKLFSDVFKKHSSAESDQLLISGTSLTTPPESAIATDWPKPWLFSRIFITLAASFAILWACCMIFGVQSAANVIPGMIFLGSLAVPFSVMVFFYEINVPRNISFFEIVKIFFLGGYAIAAAHIYFKPVYQNTRIGLHWRYPCGNC